MKKGTILLCTLFLSVTGMAHAQIFDPVLNICNEPGFQGFAQVAYNSVENEYCVVWEDGRYYDSTRTDIYGQILKADGSKRGKNFAVCTDTMQQYWPHIDYDPVENRYLVVFSDNRNASTQQWYDNYDVYAALLDKDGNHIWTPGCDADSCFGVTKNPAAIHYPDVAFNHASRSYLVVWADYRDVSGNIFGQRVSADGVLLDPSTGTRIASVDPALNFPICQLNTNNQDVPVVSYSHDIREWLVVYAQCEGMNRSSIQAQRVDRFGQLLKRDGTDGFEQITIFEETFMGRDPVQPRVQFNSVVLPALSKGNTGGKMCEALVTWRDERNAGNVNLFAQRLGFLPDADAVMLGLKGGPASDSLYYANALRVDGMPAINELPGYPVCDADGRQNAPCIAYSDKGNEYLVGWGDQRRTGDWMDPDFYSQRLHIDETNVMLWLGVEGDTVESWENFPVDTSEHFEGGNLVGAAFNGTDNEFLMAYGFEDKTSGTGGDIIGRRISFATGSAIAEQGIDTTPAGFSLNQNYPNPFNPETAILFRLSKSGELNLSVYNVSGQLVRTLIAGQRSAGRHEATWDGRNDAGEIMGSGVYFYRLNTEKQSLSKKMTFIK
jgi:hypothetical protein